MHPAGAYKWAIACDDRPDLAVIPTPHDMPRCGVLLENLDVGGSDAEDSLFVVSGIPGERFSADHRTKTIVAAHWSLGVVALPQQAWPEYSEQPPSRAIDLLLNYTNRFALNDLGESMAQIDPHGLSGSGMWSVPSRCEGVWSPTRAKLVAIQSAVEAGKWR